jgi:hypothetical protein
MDELEKAFVEVLERYRGNEPFVDIRVRDIRDVLGEKFIREGGYRTSELTAEVAALVQTYRAMSRLRRIESGRYEYALDPLVLVTRRDEVPGRIQGDGLTVFRQRERVMLEDEPSTRLRGIADKHFSSVAQLASSSTFLIVRGLDTVDLESLNGLSF